MEKIKLLLYCTKSIPRLVFTNGKWWLDNRKENTYWKKGQIAPIGYNGKIVAECDFEVEETRIVDDEIWNWRYETKTLSKNELCEKSCLSEDELFDYLGEDNEGYAIHIKNLNIFDKPKELNECWANTNAWIFSNEKLYVAPQNMRYCGDWNLKKAILISIQPQWLCKILNGEKTIEVRKKVLKEMITDA